MTENYSAFKVTGDSNTIHALDVKLRSLGGTIKDYYKSMGGLAGGAAIVPFQYAGKIDYMSKVLGISAEPLNPMQRGYESDLIM
jgi:hypothetical protein